MDLQLTEAENGKSYSVPAGSRIRIRLNENPTTGYQWSLRGFRVSVLALESDDYAMVPGGGIGGGGIRQFVFAASTAGEATIALKNMRSWEDESKAVATFSVTIRVT